MIYTAITNNYDEPREDIKVYPGIDKFISPNLNAKIYKVLPHLFMKYDYSIWVDGNVFLKQEEQWYYELLGDYDIAVLQHPLRQNVREEASICLKLNIGKADNIKDQIRAYGNDVLVPRLAQCSMIIRRNTPEVRQLCEQWWAHICRYSYRDQLSFPIVFKDMARYLPNTNHDDNQYFKRKTHAQ